ncbi:hypothetical protein L6164_013850 [Bauhinia variegata]|uniref:Uncharacterized protein n=1 Tax=Bauhinia variegata TaxID=167791 RepID=A0ACB9NKE3_BAUVA|nr:hypothetical protein L6164_013850 [Bauhinia variegata]
MVKQTMVEPAERSDSKYKGVRKRNWGKWVSEIRLPNSRERIWLGSYDSAEKAARAFDAAMFCLRGRSAKFNFPDTPPDIAGGRSLTPSQIQIAAARYANSEPHINQSGGSVTSESPPEESYSASISNVTMFPMESPSHSLSEGTVQTDSDVPLNGPFSNLFTSNSTESGNYATEYGIFPGFDDLSSDYYTPTMPTVDYGEENMEGLIVQDSFLWNF